MHITNYAPPWIAIVAETPIKINKYLGVLWALSCYIWFYVNKLTDSPATHLLQEKLLKFRDRVVFFSCYYAEDPYWRSV